MLSIAEDLQNDPAMTQPTAEGGAGFDASHDDHGAHLGNVANSNPGCTERCEIQNLTNDVDCAQGHLIILGEYAAQIGMHGQRCANQPRAFGPGPCALRLERQLDLRMRPFPRTHVLARLRRLKEPKQLSATMPSRTG